MARETGHTIAVIRHLADLRLVNLLGVAIDVVLPRSRGCKVLAILVMGCLVTDASSWGGGPAGKSRYRNASHNGTEAESDDQKQPGVFGLRSILGGRRSDATSRKDELLSAVPMDRLTVEAQQKLAAVSDKPTLYRRLPIQAIRCDEELLLFLTRKPDSIIGIWDLMDITKVQAKRTGPYQIDASDGSGTTCKIDLLYGDRNLHVFLADGMYEGKFAQKPIRGKGVFIFKSTYAQAADGSTTATGTLDYYIKFEGLATDLLARSLGGLIGKSADHNFVETSKFISQISQASENNPDGMLELIDQMPQVDVKTKSEFARVVLNVSQRHVALTDQAAKLVRDRGIRQTQR